MTFHVGQKVVCVEEWIDWYGPETLPRKGKMYTIRELIDIGLAPSMRLMEIVNPVNDCWLNVEPCEIAFDRSAFRPIVEKKTDISIFTEILRKVTRKDRVKA